MYADQAIIGLGFVMHQASDSESWEVGSEMIVYHQATVAFNRVPVTRKA